MFFTTYLSAVISGLIIGFAFRKRVHIGRTASNLAGAAGIAMLVNGVLLGPAVKFLDDMAGDWTAGGQHVPAAWRLTENALTVLSAVLQVAVVVLLAAAVFVPRPPACASRAKPDGFVLRPEG
jgi:hypothetical protein